MQKGWRAWGARLIFGQGILKYNVDHGFALSPMLSQKNCTCPRNCRTCGLQVATWELKMHIRTWDCMGKDVMLTHDLSFV